MCLLISWHRIYYKKLYFFLQDEPLAPESLVEYLRKEKNTQNAHPNYAHANHTGKGLLFFCKTHEDKAKPTGMFNLVRIHTIHYGNAGTNLL